jgi:hypothetical protein
MKKNIFLLFLLFSISSFSQKKEILKDKLNIKLGYQHYPWMGDIATFSNDGITPTGYCDANYRINKLFSVGATLGYGMYNWIDLSPPSSISENSSSSDIVYFIKKKPMFLYGINTNFYVLPLFFGNEKTFLDLYISSKLGGIFFADENKNFTKRSHWDYGVYGGLSIHPFKHWGVYGEYGFGNYVKWKAGVNLFF